MKRMRRLWMAFILPLISLGGLGLSLNLGAPAALAQGGLLKAQPHGVDITRFPTVTVFFQLVDLSRGLPTAQRVEVRSVREAAGDPIGRMEARSGGSGGRYCDPPGCQPEHSQPPIPRLYRGTPSERGSRVCVQGGPG